MATTMFPHSGQGSGGRPVAGKPHAGKCRELTLPRQRGGRGTLTLSLTLWLIHLLCENIPKIAISVKSCILKSYNGGIDNRFSLAYRYLVGQERADIGG
jgi:hypothetical protein